MGLRLRTSICPPAPGASGRHRAGSVGPKITTPDAPAAAARCDTPESTPTKADARRAIAATVGKSRCFRTGTPDSRKIGSIDISAGPRMTATLFSGAATHNALAGMLGHVMRFSGAAALRESITTVTISTRAPRIYPPASSCRDFRCREKSQSNSSCRIAIAQSRARLLRGRPGSVRAVNPPAGQGRQFRFQLPASKPLIRGRRRRGGTDETRRAHRSPPPIARENAGRPRRRTSRCDRNPRRIGARCPKCHQRITRRPRERLSNGRVRRRFFRLRAGLVPSAPSARPTRPDGAARSPQAPASST